MTFQSLRTSIDRTSLRDLVQIKYKSNIMDIVPVEGILGGTLIMVF